MRFGRDRNNRGATRQRVNVSRKRSTGVSRDDTWFTGRTFVNDDLAALDREKRKVARPGFDECFARLELTKRSELVDVLPFLVTQHGEGFAGSGLR